jgi:hypothetical protein
MKRIIPGSLFPFLYLLLMPSLYAEDIRSWVDADGTVHFGDRSAAPEDSKPVQLSPGSVVKITPAPLPSPSLPVAVAVPPSAKRHCTPVMRDYVDPKTGMHSERDTGRCEEDGDVVPSDEYPYYYWGPCNGPACVQPPPPIPPRPQPLPPSSGMGGFPLIPFR